MSDESLSHFLFRFKLSHYLFYQLVSVFLFFSFPFFREAI